MPESENHPEFAVEAVNVERARHAAVAYIKNSDWEAALIELAPIIEATENYPQAAADAHELAAYCLMSGSSPDYAAAKSHLGNAEELFRARGEVPAAMRIKQRWMICDLFESA